MLRHRTTERTQERATRFGARANACLGGVQFIFGLLSGNVGFYTEAAHQTADGLSLGAKANAMRSECAPEKARLLRYGAAAVILAGGVAGLGGGLEHLYAGTTEASSWVELTGAGVGATVNSAIALYSHGAEHQHHGHAHHEGAAADSKLHIVTDMAAGWIYAIALALETKVPGIANGALLVNGSVSSGTGIYTMRRIHQDQQRASSGATIE